MPPYRTPAPPEPRPQPRAEPRGDDRAVSLVIAGAGACSILADLGGRAPLGTGATVGLGLLVLGLFGVIRAG